MSKKILVADDDQGIVEAMGVVLAEYGYDAKVTTDGGCLYDLHSNPDLVLLDMLMSGQDGRDICRYLKRHDSTKDIPVVMISASSDGKKGAREAGADDFLAKPFDVQDLINKIERNIHKSN